MNYNSTFHRLLLLEGTRLVVWMSGCSVSSHVSSVEVSSMEQRTLQLPGDILLTGTPSDGNNLEPAWWATCRLNFKGIKKGLRSTDYRLIMLCSNVVHLMEPPLALPRFSIQLWLGESRKRAEVPPRRCQLIEVKHAGEATSKSMEIDFKISNLISNSLKCLPACVSTSYSWTSREDSTRIEFSPRVLHLPWRDRRQHPHEPVLRPSRACG
jgi:hypothetical protein